MFCMLKKKNIYPAFASKHNSNCAKQLISLMILNGEGWHFLAVKQWSVLLRGITSKNNGDVYSLNCVHSFRTKSRLQSQKKLCKNRDFCNVVMPPVGTKILELNRHEKSDKAPFIN